MKECKNDARNCQFEVVFDFAFFCNFPEGVKENYKRYLENNLREKFDFTGVPLRLFFRKK